MLQTTRMDIMFKNCYKIKPGYEFTPYTYLLTHKNSGKKYYGSRTAECAHPDFFFKDYFTSCELVNAILEREGLEAFNFEIRKTFKDAESCLLWEQKVLMKLKVHQNDNFINKDSSLKLSQNKGTIFISNPISGKCIRIKKTSPIPEGWILGNINMRGKTYQRKRSWYYDPVTLEPQHISNGDTIPLHLVPGRGPGYKSNSETLKSKNQQHITNGIESILINKKEPIPSGWYKGRTFKIKPSGKRKHKWKWITDEITDIQIKVLEIIPPGWRVGMSRTYKFKAVIFEGVQYDSTKKCRALTKLPLYELIERGLSYAD